ncbi:MAG: histidine phosphatase family protein [Candidatus Eisenbacteria bacterium]|uniref:Histidine phosphatase family protein n=1 Tax=Eiseniibacteriota bacterium TaxID=2212470 RepID=A0A933SE31_UNCEI|nr:histidine phosphatase family protein [Candidatus Eisenbacteria bacterium]
MRTTSGVLLLRHGETEWNALGRLQGRDDSPLTPLGREQAATLAAWAARRGLRRLVASPLGRAQATAAAIAEACGATIATREALAEMSFGDCAGLTLEQCEQRFPGVLAERARNRWAHRWPGGECYDDAIARLHAWLEAEPEALAGEGVAVVAHQALNRALLTVLTGCPREAALEGAQSAAQAIEILPDRSWRVLEIAGPAPATHPDGVI